VSRASKGMTAGLASGVAFAVQLPIASTLVVTAWAAFISTAPVEDLFSSDIDFDPFSGWAAGGDASLNELAGEDDTGRAALRAKITPAPIAIRLAARSPSRARLIQASRCFRASTGILACTGGSGFALLKSITFISIRPACVATEIPRLVLIRLIQLSLPMLLAICR
jgi:hypothetical protein